MDSIFRWDNGLFHITTDRSLLDIDAIHQYLTVSTWAKDIDKKTVAGAIEKSICFGLFYESKQVGFARVVTDGFTFGYLCDVYVLNGEIRNWEIGLLNVATHTLSFND